MSLKDSKCEPCEGIGSPLTREESEQLLTKVSEWVISEDSLSISKKNQLKNFVECVQAIEKIKDIAEADDHHPDIHLTGYKNLEIVLSTHAIGGLSKNDFILAAKIDEAL